MIKRTLKVHKNSVQSFILTYGNLWQFSSQSEESLDCLDIGIKLDKITNCSSINLFIPFHIDKQHIDDLGQIITKDRELIKAIFNEFNKIGTVSPNLVEVTLDNNRSGNSTEEKFYSIFH